KAVAAGDKVFRAVSPVATDTGARANIHVASGDLGQLYDRVDWDAARGGTASPDIRPRAVLNATNDYMQEMYQKEVGPKIQGAAGAPVRVDSSAAAGLDHLAKTAGEPEVRAAAERASQSLKTSGSVPLQDAYTVAKGVNAELNKFSRLTGDQQYL